MNLTPQSLSACKKRFAFTLLELMIALGLLGALMAVAWSLMGTFRNAEIRGWKLAHRTQTIRTAHVWLESDMQHLNQQVSQPLNFTGNAMGFSMTIAPSIDPIPFLENLMSDGREPPRLSSTSIDEIAGSVSDGAPNSPWPADSLDIEYRLTPFSSSPSIDTQFILTRSEMTAASSQSTTVNLSERILTAQDLYRQTDEPINSGNQPNRETRLEGLTNAQFRYYDGTSWKSDWNSSQQNGAPRAIAFGFDFPAASDVQTQSSASPKQRGQESSLIDSGFAAASPFADSALASESTAHASSADNQTIMESSTNEVQLVVYVGRGGLRSKAVPHPQSTSGGPTAEGLRNPTRKRGTGN